MVPYQLHLECLKLDNKWEWRCFTIIADDSKIYLAKFIDVIDGDYPPLLLPILNAFSWFEGLDIYHFGMPMYNIPHIICLARKRIENYLVFSTTKVAPPKIVEIISKINLNIVPKLKVLREERQLLC